MNDMTPSKATVINEKLNFTPKLIIYYTYGKVKGVIEHMVICSSENVDDLFKKYSKRGYSTMEIGDYKGLCDDCILTACWDKGKAIRCSIKRTK